jgi:hypothetical protein
MKHWSLTVAEMIALAFAGVIVFLIVRALM